MNATFQARRAYGAKVAPTRTERGTEYEILARITHRLKSTAARKDTHFAEFAEALNDNRRLWQIFATDVASDENKLPKDLRAQIFYLAEFTFVQTRKVLRRQENVSSLIDINTAIMRGLNPRSG